jgi:hypothetical protein
MTHAFGRTLSRLPPSIGSRPRALLRVGPAGFACHYTRGKNQAAIAQLALRLPVSTLEVSDPGVRPKRHGAHATGTNPI